MTPELLNKLKHLANIAAHLPYDVTLEDEDAAMKALHGELAADTVLQMIALAERALLAAAPAPIQKDTQAAQLAVTTHANAHSTTVVIKLMQDGKATCIYSADHSANGESIGVSDLPDGIFHIAKQAVEPCGGCGETDPANRCIGCRHPFSATPPALAGSQVQAAGDVPWRVAEFWSSANPDKKCLMLAKDEQELSEWGKRSDFIRWCSPDPKAMREQP